MRKTNDDNPNKKRDAKPEGTDKERARADATKTDLNGGFAWSGEPFRGHPFDQADGFYE